MSTVAEAMALAVEHHQAGRLAEAESIYEQVLAAAPNHADALHLLGVVNSQRGRHEAAIDYIGRAIRLNPDQAVYHGNLGLAYRGLGRLEEAEASYRQALARQPDFADARYNLGIVLKARGSIEEAIACYRKTLDIAPDHVNALNSLANVLSDRGELDEAVACYERAIHLRPAFFQAHTNLGAALRARGELERAAACHRRALELNPDFAQAHLNLGNVLKVAGRLEEAVVCYREAVRLEPDYARAHNSLASVLKDQGQPEEAAACYRRALEIEPDRPLWELRLSALCPVVFESNEAIEEYRRECLATWTRLGEESRSFSLSELVTSASEPPLGLEYQGRDDRPLKEAYASIFAGTFPSEISSAGSGRPRIGFVVTGRHEAAFCASMGGVLQRITPGRFDLVVVCNSIGAERLREAIRSDSVGMLGVPEQLDLIARSVGDARFDVLYHWEAGTDATNYFLPFFRLAPVQCTSWGLPETSGNARMDCYLSSELVEPEGAEEHYTERLILADTLLTYQRRPARPESLKAREAFGFGEGQHLYLCAQNLQKIQPDFDSILAGVLRGDGLGVVVLVEDQTGYAAERLRARFAANLPDVADRIVFLPRQPYADYLGLLAACDVLLDPLYFGGGFTTYDAFSLARPVVTLPTRFQRGRYTFGCYRKMGLTDCVADSPEDYVAIALRLGTNADYRAAVAERIGERSEVLFEDMGAVREYERIFGELVDEARGG